MHFSALQQSLLTFVCQILLQDASHLVLSSLGFRCELWVHFSTAVLQRTKGLGDETFSVLSSESHSGLITLALFSLSLKKNYKIIKPDRYVYFSVYTLSKYRCEQTKECVIWFFIGSSPHWTVNYVSVLHNKDVIGNNFALPWQTRQISRVQEFNLVIDSN